MLRADKTKLSLTFVSIILILILIIGSSNSRSNRDYISITSTAYNQDNPELMTTSIYKYSLKEKKIKEMFNFPYTAQYPLGVYSENEKSVYFTKRDGLNHDQIFIYNIGENREYQLTTDLRGVNQIVPTKTKIFFVASSKDRVLRLGAIDKKTKDISYWGDSDINVETITLNPDTQKIYISGFSYSKDRESIKKQFISDDNVYTMPLFTIYETNYNFDKSKELFSKKNWLRLLLIDRANNSLITIYDKEYNSLELSKAIIMDMNSGEISEFEIPKERMQADGAGLSRDGTKMYGIFAPDDERGVYLYESEKEKYTPVFIPKEAFINNFQIIYTNQ